MAVSFISLSDRIRDKDPQGFLLSYLQLVVAGKQLVLPTSDAYDTIKSAWESILYGVPGGYSSVFLIQLSNMWLRIVKAIPSSKDPSFSRRVLEYLQTHDLSELDLPVIKNLPQKPKGKTLQKGRPVIDHLDDDQVEERLQVPTAHPAVAPTLSSSEGSAYDHVHTESLDFSPAPETDIKMHDALRSEEVDTFLIHYLTKTLHQITPQIPMSSVMDIIYYQWRDILMGEFNQLPSERFLKLLSKRWFGLMTQKGLPNSRDKIKALIYIVMKGSGAASSSTSTGGGPMRKKRSFWQLFMKALMGCFIISFFVISAGCRDKVTVYSVPKELLVTDVSVAASFQEAKSPQDLPYQWVVPKNWATMPSESGFDRARYRVSVGDQAVIVAITSMTGAAPDMLSNLNRWRGQLKMAPATPSELTSSVTSKKLGEFSTQWASVSNGTDAFEIAFIRHDDENWFFKASGSHAAVKAMIPQLQQLISSMQHVHGAQQR